VLHLEVQGLVVDPEEARRRALVPAWLEGPSDRLFAPPGGGWSPISFKEGCHLVTNASADLRNSQASERRPPKRRQRATYSSGTGAMPSPLWPALSL